jgi:hypothetical protein
MRRRTFLGAGLAGALARAALAKPAPDGRSIEASVVIRSDSGSLGGVASEGEWLREHYPGWRRIRQALLGRDGRRFDRIDLESPSGERVSVYFDITNAIGLR